MVVKIRWFSPIKTVHAKDIHNFKELRVEETLIEPMNVMYELDKLGIYEKSVYYTRRI